jgi:hypothetical protein
VSDYPPAPWHLGGWGVATVSLVDVRAMRANVPRGAHVVSVVPGKTLGGLLFLAYERGPLTYRELNVVAGLVRIGARLAFWIPRLYVDSAASLAGGREIWGVPKELADFDVQHEIGATTIAVRQGEHAVCRIRSSVATSGLRVRLPMPAFGTRGADFLLFTAGMESRVARVRATVEMPRDGEFATLGLERPRLAIRAQNLSLVVPIPRAVPRAMRARAETEAVYGTS